MTTLMGQTGSPVIYDEKTIAFHIRSGEIDGQGRALYNVGRLLTLDVIANLQKWAKEMEADPFQLDTEDLCPHLQGAIQVKHVASDAFEIIEMQFSDPKPYIPRELRFDA